MKYKKLLVWISMLVIVSGFLAVPIVRGATITPTGPTNIENVPLSILSVLGKIADWGHAILDRLFSHRKLGATILTTNLTDTIGTFRTNTNTNFNTLNSAISDTTSSLGIFANLASTTGNLIVGSSTIWRAMVVGSNGSVLTASSTAPGGLAWVSSGGGITSLNGSTSSTQTFSNGTGISVSTLNGVHTITNSAPNFNTTTTLTAGNGITVSNGGVGATTVTFSASVATATITTATSTDLGVATLHFSSDNTMLKTGYQNIGFNVYNATTSATATTTVQKLFYQASTIKQIDCFTNGSNITITADKRASSTPDTLGTSMLGSLVCASGGTSTSTITSSTIAALQILNFNLTSVPNSTTTLRVNIKFSND